jgi:hypothetical protein
MTVSPSKVACQVPPSHGQQHDCPRRSQPWHTTCIPATNPRWSVPNLLLCSCWRSFSEYMALKVCEPRPQSFPLCRHLCGTGLCPCRKSTRCSERLNSGSQTSLIYFHGPWHGFWSFTDRSQGLSFSTLGFCVSSTMFQGNYHHSPPQSVSSDIPHVEQLLQFLTVRHSYTS